MSIILSRYRNVELQELVDELNDNYYNRLSSICSTAMSAAVKLMTDEHNPSTALYSSLSVKLIEQINELVAVRQTILIPYIKDLAVKKQEGHDCRNCSGGCHVGHTSHLHTLKDSHKHIKEILFRLQSVALPLYTNTVYTETYSKLRSEMTRVDTILTELFYLEEANLVPRVFEAQRSIHA